MVTHCCSIIQHLKRNHGWARSRYGEKEARYNQQRGEQSDNKNTKNNLLVPLLMLPIQPPYLKWYDLSAHSDYRGGVVGHSTEIYNTCLVQD